MNTSPPEFTFANRPIGINHPPLVVAEAGINHNGDVNKAKELVDAAVECGCDAIKFQTHIAQQEMLPQSLTPGALSQQTVWEIINQVELNQEEEVEIQAYCKSKGILFFSTPFSREAADRLNQMGVSGYKIGAGECNNLPLLRHVASFGKPIILSTGMNGLDSVKKSVSTIASSGCDMALLHCVSIYPTPYEKVGLGCITQLQNQFPDRVIGLSDHSDDVWTALGSVALGASILEKHFTVSKNWDGPDISISIDPAQMKNLVKGAKAIWQARGGAKSLHKEEQPVMDFAFASVVSIAPIKKGEKLSQQNTWVKRAGKGGIPAAEIESVWGKHSTTDIEPNTQIQPNEIE